MFVEINSETAQVIVPTAEIINPDLKGVEGLIYEDDLIECCQENSPNSWVMQNTISGR